MSFSYAVLATWYVLVHCNWSRKTRGFLQFSQLGECLYTLCMCVYAREFQYCFLDVKNLFCCQSNSIIQMAFGEKKKNGTKHKKKKKTLWICESITLWANICNNLFAADIQFKTTYVMLLKVEITNVNHCRHIFLKLSS